MNDEPIQFFNRYSGNIETEAIYGEPFLRWAYGNPLGRLSVECLAKRWLFSHWYGWRMGRPASRQRIRPFVETFHLDSSEFEKSLDDFDHFNHFFSRTLKPTARPIDPSPLTVTFPADGRHLGFQNLSTTDTIFVKGQRFNLEALFQDSMFQTRYETGTAILSRLCPTDYHRFHFACEGIPAKSRLIPGSLYSVSPLALRESISYLWQNKRMITTLETTEYGLVTIIEFGATNVGSIRQTYTPDTPVTKGQEKGFFSFGGSATMTFFEAGRVQLMPDLLEHSKVGREIYARMGDCMATTAT